jgi:hypothetical protein
MIHLCCHSRHHIQLTLTYLQKIGYRDNNAILGAIMFTIYVPVICVLLITDIVCSILLPELQADKVSIIFLVFMTILTLIPHVVQLFEGKKSK